MSDQGHFTSESDSTEHCRRTHGAEFPVRAACLAASVLGTALLLGVLYAGRVVPDQIALGDVAMAVPCSFEGRRINAWRLTDYPIVYPSSSDGTEEEWLWLGNSQLHAINQPTADDRTAPAVASELCGFPVFGLSLPNATLVEHLAVIEWAIPRRRPSWVILAVCYDDLRNDEYRPGWTALAKAEGDFIARLDARPACTELTKQIAQEEGPSTIDLQKTSVGGESSILGVRFLAESLQDKSETRLGEFASEHFPVWRDRDQMWARVLAEAYHFRNFVFGITPQTKRKMIPTRYAKNMAALREVIEKFDGSGTRLLVYVCPLRFDIEPPYVMADYETWKRELKAEVETRGSCFADLDRVVPGGDWGTFGKSLDFMHFQGKGHRLLGAAVTAAIREQCGSKQR